MEIMACPTASDSPGKQLESNDVVINVPLVMAMGPAMEPGCCIYRVPKKLREVNKKAYIPKFVSIGPFHRGKQELQDMEMHKLRYLKDFFCRTSTYMRPEDLVKSAEKIIQDNGQKIRHCYLEDCSLKTLNGKDFVKMILLDAIFIIELFLKDKEKEEEKEEEDCKKQSDYILSQPWLQIGIRHDLILIENQLPFFVLEELYKFTGCNNRKECQQIEEHKEDLKEEDSPFGCQCCHHQEGQQIKGHKKDTPFVELSRKYFRFYDKEPKLMIDEEVKHLTDLLRYLFLPSDMKNKKIIKRSLGTRLCATKLNDAGLNFKAVEDHKRLLDISVRVPGVLCINPCFVFSCFFACLPCFICLLLTQRTFEVPQLVIDDDTETIFRNLMALEQCHYPSQTYVCSYVLLLDRLLDTDEDVDLLVREKVIVHHLGSNTDVASLINKLGLQIAETPFSYFNHIDKMINRHYTFPLNHTIATLKRQYFPNIFRGTATMVGLIVLFFTFWNFLKPFVE